MNEKKFVSVAYVNSLIYNSYTRNDGDNDRVDKAIGQIDLELATVYEQLDKLMQYETDLIKEQQEYLRLIRILENK